MSITNIERMVDALDIIRDKIELMGNGEIVKEYESLVWTN